MTTGYILVGALALFLAAIAAVIVVSACIASGRYNQQHPQDERLAAPPPAPQARQVGIRRDRTWDSSYANIVEQYIQKVEATNGRH